VGVMVPTASAITRASTGILWLNSPNHVTGKRQGRRLLSAVLKMGWLILESTPQERALLAAHVLASGRVQ
jgi:hypothetical protein